jgi:ABC-type sugar transport system ATPase subunit
MSHNVVDTETETNAAGPVLIEARALGKTYPGVVALENVSLTLRAGQIHALLGENGAGKSTLIGLLSGTKKPDSGELLVDGEVRQFTNPKQAQELGISTIYQEQTLAPDLTVTQNVFFGRELKKGKFLLDELAMRRRVEELSGEFGLSPSDLDRAVGTLGALKQHVVQILKALAFDARVVILDEPTSGLEDDERQMLFEHMARLRDRGVALLWVTHRLDEIFGLADVITVLRDSRWIASVDPAGHTPDSLVRLMVGRKQLATEYDQVHAHRERGQGQGSGEEHLRLESVTRYPLVRDVSLTVIKGEILGIAGIAGAGRTELARIILGADRPDSGKVFIEGRPVSLASPREAAKRGISLVPEERKTQSILGTMSIAKNISISDLSRVTRMHAVLDRRKENGIARSYINDLGIKARDAQQKIVNLSGGNQQKAIVARCLFNNPSLLIFDEPTQGVDVAAKAEIYRLIYDFVDGGGAAIVISSELPELLSLSDRIVVMREGRLVGEVAGVGRQGNERSESESAELIMSMAARNTGLLVDNTLKEGVA